MKIEEILSTSDVSRNYMPLPNDLLEIFIKARKRTKKCVIKAFKEGNDDDFLKYLRAYRGFTKLIQCEPLSIFDF